MCVEREVMLCVIGARFLSRSDSVTVSVWNNRKVHKKEGAGFLGCVRLTPPTISRLRDTGCESVHIIYVEIVGTVRDQPPSWSGRTNDIA